MLAESIRPAALEALFQGCQEGLPASQLAVHRLCRASSSLARFDEALQRSTELDRNMLVVREMFDSDRLAKRSGESVQTSGTWSDILTAFFDEDGMQSFANYAGSCGDRTRLDRYLATVTSLAADAVKLNGNEFLSDELLGTHHKAFVGMPSSEIEFDVRGTHIFRDYLTADFLRNPTPWLARMAYAYLHLARGRALKVATRRFARLLLPAWLVNQRIVAYPHLFLGGFFLRNYSNYCSFAKPSGGTATYLSNWLEFFLAAITHSCDSARSALERAEAHRRNASDVYTARGAEEQIMCSLRKWPAVTTNSLMAVLDCKSDRTISNALQGLTSKGVLAVASPKRERCRVYIDKGYLGAFDYEVPKVDLFENGEPTPDGYYMND